MDHHEVKRRIVKIVSDIQTSEDDRIDIELCGCQVRAWRTRINCKIEYHLGYKAKWETNYYKNTPERLIEFLTQRVGAHQES